MTDFIYNTLYLLLPKIIRTALPGLGFLFDEALGEGDQ